MAKKISKARKIRLYYDSYGNTLNVWFDDPQKEYSSEETGEEVVLNKDKRGKVIGFEKLRYLETRRSIKKLPIETSIS